MRLNGWQRLWVFVCVLWAMIVALFTLTLWPSGSLLPASEVSERMERLPAEAIRGLLTPEENSVLNESEFGIAKHRGLLVNPYERPDASRAPVAVVSPDVPTSASLAPVSIAGFSQLIKRKYPDYANVNDDVLVADVLAKYPVYRRQIDPEAIATASQRYNNVIAAQKRVTTIAETLATNALVRESRTRFAWVALTGWVITSSALYALGWGVGWIRRGFRPQGS